MTRFLNCKRSQAIFAGLVLLLLRPAGVAAGDATLPLLTNAAQLRRLSLNEAGRGYPARLRGVSTFFHGNESELFLQDETGGVRVRAREGAGFELGVGQLLDIEGTSVAGALSSELKPTHVILIGEGPLPPAVRVMDEQLEARQAEGSRVEISGVVHAVQPGRTDALLGLEIASGSNTVVALIKDYHLEDCRRLVDAEVSIAGVLWRSQHGQPEILATSMGDITASKHPPVDPFATSANAISAVRTLAETSRPNHRIKVCGTVTLQQPGRGVVIQDLTHGLFAATDQRTRLEPGDIIELVGFPTIEKRSWPTLQHAVFRKTGSGSPPPPRPMSTDEAAAATGGARLITLEGDLLERERIPASVLKVQSSNIIFRARFAEAAQDFARSMKEGSRLRLTGICLPCLESTNGPSSFELLLRSPADVTVVAGIQPPSVGRAVCVVVGVLAVVGLLAGVVMKLRARSSRTG